MHSKSDRNFQFVKLFAVNKVFNKLNFQSSSQLVSQFVKSMSFLVARKVLINKAVVRSVCQFVKHCCRPTNYEQIQLVKNVPLFIRDI